MSVLYIYIIVYVQKDMWVTLLELEDFNNQNDKGQIFYVGLS